MKTMLKLNCLVFCLSVLGSVTPAFASDSTASDAGTTEGDNSTYIESFASDDASDDDATTEINAEEGTAYVKFGVNYYSMSLPKFTLPFSTGSGSGYRVDSASSSPLNLENNMNAAQPSLTLGLRLYNDDEILRKIFGEESHAEVRYSYAHDSNSGTENYSDLSGNGFYITGNNFSFSTGDSTVINSDTYSYDDTIQALGFYYIGDKTMGAQLKSAPYFGFDLVKVEQDDHYSLAYAPPNEGAPTDYSTGSDNLNTYYYGLSLGDKLTMDLGQKFNAFASAGFSLLNSHTDLDANQVPDTTAPGSLNFSNYNVSTTDDKFTYRGKLELGSSYYFKGNANPDGAHLTLAGGWEYWNDVPYAQNPTSTNSQVKIDYAKSTSYYLGLNLVAPIL
jgi:hypothetical protein